MNPANEHIARVLADTNEVWPTEVVFQERKEVAGEAEKQAMPEPAFRLTWSDDRARYSVNKPRIGDTDVYTADQVRLLVEEAVKFKALYEKSQELFARERGIAKELAAALKDLAWRIDDIRDMLMKRNGRDESIYGCDEWSTPTVNLAGARLLIDAALCKVQK